MEEADKHLAIDDQTFRDLEIFSGREGRSSLFRMLDCAKTAGGMTALRRRFMLPLADARDISDVHVSLRYIQNNPAAFADLPSQYVVSGFNNYFHKILTAPVAGHKLGLLIDMLTLQVDDSADYSKIKMGVRHAAQILQWFRRLADHAARVPAEGELRRLIEEVRTILAMPSLTMIPNVPERRWHFWTILSVDRAIRNIARDEFERLLTLVFEIDALVSMAQSSASHGFTLPEILDGPTRVEADVLFHPFLEEQVCNSLRLDQHARLMFITGPNMAGKTTYLRTCGTALYLAHLGMGVPAARFRFTPVQALYTAISLSDDVRAGISFFQAEAIRARTIAQSLADSRRTIAILDEPFKGTNLKDALDASCAFFSRLARCDNSLFLVASHLIEAAQRLGGNSGIQYRCFYAVDDQTGLQFDYVLKDGLSDQRLGMRVLEQHGVMELLDSVL